MIEKYFEEITDKRREWKTKHNLLEIIIMTICAVIAEREAWYQIEEYCEEKEGGLKEKLGLKLTYGIPSHDTFERVFAMIEPEKAGAVLCIMAKGRKQTDKRRNSKHRRQEPMRKQRRK